MKIQRATFDQIDDMYRVELNSFSDPWGYDEYLMLFKSDLYDVFVSNEAGIINGLIVVMRIEPEAEILNICVLPEYRNKKVASSLLSYTLDKLRTEHFESVYLEVRESNIAAQSLYYKFGFQEYARRKSYYLNPSENAILMKKSIQ